MNVLLQNVTICDPASPYDGQRTDILIENGNIRQIGKYISPEGLKLVKGDHLHAAPGFMDLHAHLRDPGYEYKESLESGAQAAAAGGFTAVLTLPDTLPVLDTKSTVEYILKRSASLPVDIIPAGALSQDLAGKEMAELYDMHVAGAKAFTDGEHSVNHSGLLVRAMMYALNFGGKIHVRCDDKTISHGGQMHEGPMSTSLGLKGIPSLAEELMIARNIYLAEYAGAPLHFMAVSTARSVEQIRSAKKIGLPITAAVHASHLLWTDEMLSDFDTNYKLDPPLRSEEDRLALIEGVADGTIDAITSGHTPEDVESKVVEFDIAHNGIIGLETAFSLACSTGKLTPQQLVKAFSPAPRTIAGVDIPKIKVGEKANITVFDPTRKWIFTEKDIRSKSKNTPLIGKELTGKIVGVFCKGVWSE
ncbi:MAG TPA: dihydroorotase [Bacteroidia bacterium]|jgi:dihydroorotase|nr:dihydroorotase [Bacteroidia bacterium]